MNGGESNQQQQPEQQQNQQQQQIQQHQQWVAMQQLQYQQQWMAMQQHMLYYRMPPYYHPQHQQWQHYYQQKHQPSKQNRRTQQDSDEDNRTIWIGDLQQWMDDAYLQSCFSHAGEVVSVKIIRNKQTGQSDGYGFVEFSSHSAAEKVLESYNGTIMPNTDLPFRINWAAFRGVDRQPEPGSDLSIFVGDLANDVTDAVLHDTFATKYPSVKGAKVVMDPNSGRSKSYGFVRFGDEDEKSLAITEMNGVLCSSRPMRISVATPKKPSPQQQVSSQGGYASNQSENDSSNTTIFVGGLDSDVNDEELRQYFTPFGELTSIKIPVGKGCGFVQFVSRSCAEDAIERLNGSVIGKQTVRLAWGRNLGNKQWRTDYNNQWNGGGYRGSQGHNGYAYGANAAYRASSTGHGNNQQQQPVS